MTGVTATLGLWGAGHGAQVSRGLETEPQPVGYILKSFS